MSNYSKYEVESEKQDNLFLNSNNEESFYDNQSSYYESNARISNSGNFATYSSTDTNNYCYDVKMKELNNESKYNIFNKDPK